MDTPQPSQLPIDVEQRQRESALFASAYAAYREKMDSRVSVLPLVEYVELQVDRKGMNALLYNGMLTEHPAQIANDLNAFVFHYQQLVCWNEVVSQYDDRGDRLLLVREFADCVASYLLNFPYSLVQRIAFSVSHLAHQANLTTHSDWNEGKLPPDEKITVASMRKVAMNWPAFAKVEAALALMNGKPFADATDEYRRKQNHRIPPRFELGLTQLVQRERRGKRAAYGVGGKPALKLGDLLEPLALEHEHARTAYAAYIELIKEQTEAVVAKQRGT